MERATRILPLLFAVCLLLPAGAHTPALVDGDGSVVDTVAFSVRGNPVARP